VTYRKALREKKQEEAVVQKASEKVRRKFSGLLMKIYSLKLPKKMSRKLPRNKMIFWLICPSVPEQAEKE